MRAFLSSLNENTLVSVASIQNEDVATEVPEKIESTANLLATMGYIVLQKAPDGSLSAKLTPSGAYYASNAFTGGQ